MSIIITFTKHAKQRAKERKILRNNVKEALINPTKIIQVENNKFICYHKFGNARTLTIVFIKQKQFVKIITLYWL